MDNQEVFHAELVADRREQMQIALSLLPSFEFGKLSLPQGRTPLDQLPTFEQRQLDQLAHGISSYRVQGG